MFTYYYAILSFQTTQPVLFCSHEAIEREQRLSKGNSGKQQHHYKRLTLGLSLVLEGLLDKLSNGGGEDQNGSKETCAPRRQY